MLEIRCVWYFKYWGKEYPKAKVIPVTYVCHEALVKRDRQLYMSLTLRCVFPVLIVCWQWCSWELAEEQFSWKLNLFWGRVNSNWGILWCSPLCNYTNITADIGKGSGERMWSDQVTHTWETGLVCWCTDVGVFMLKRDRAVILENFLSAVKFSASEAF